jgi:geranyl-CoA carboxylase beta subunit
MRTLEQVRTVEAEAASASARAAPLFAKRGQLLPRQRVALLMDRGAPFLELMSLAGYDGEKGSTAGANQIVGIGRVSGVDAMIVASDAGIDAGAITEAGREKILRAQGIALDMKLPFLHLVESAGANLLSYRVDDFIKAGAIFRNLARLSAAGIPVITVVHGSSTAGGAYMPGLSDHVVMVRGRARAFLAGPPLLKAATGEIATDEALGGAEMHASVSGLAEHVAEHDRDALAMARRIVSGLGWDRGDDAAERPAAPPRYSAAGLRDLMPIDNRTPVDMRRVLERLVDGSEWMEFKADFGPATLCASAAIQGRRIGLITNNGPIDQDGAAKAAHFIQACCQVGTPLIYLQNTTGFAVGTAHERGGIIKHGSKMIQAVSNATVPQVTIHCGASYGAGNYGMCGRSFGPSFVFSWPTARTAVMGGAQAAGTMRAVAEARATRGGHQIDEEALAEQDRKLIGLFDGQSDAITTSSLLLDDGIIDPADTRHILCLVLALAARAGGRTLNPVQFGVARM